jgi:ribonucleoside-diphosphate reductase beta chain
MEYEESRGFRYYRNAVERHWDPAEISFERDRENMLETYDEMSEEARERVGGVQRKLLAMFGAGEASVTEDIAPLAIAFDDMEDEMFITTHIYEEAKHAELFDRYWDEVINAVEDEIGMERTSPNDDQWFCEDYETLFDKEEERMHRLLHDDTPENRVRAMCTYQLTAEGIIAQTGYWGITKNFRDHAGKEVDVAGSTFQIPELPGLVEGIEKIRQDEGRHVGFGMAKVKEHIESGDVTAEFVRDEIAELLPHTIGITNYAYEDLEDPSIFPIGPGDAASYTQEKHQERMRQITDAERDVPGLDELTALGD